MVAAREGLVVAAQKSKGERELGWVQLENW